MAVLLSNQTKGLLSIEGIEPGLIEQIGEIATSQKVVEALAVNIKYYKKLWEQSKEFDTADSISEYVLETFKDAKSEDVVNLLPKLEGMDKFEHYELLTIVETAESAEQLKRYTDLTKTLQRVGGEVYGDFMGYIRD